MSATTLPTKHDIMDFLHTNVFDSVLMSTHASSSLRAGVRHTIYHMNRLTAESMVEYYWNAIIGTDRSTRFARRMRAEGFTRFEDPGVIDEFRERFNCILDRRRRRLHK